MNFKFISVGSSSYPSPLKIWNFYLPGYQNTFTINTLKTTDIRSPGREWKRQEEPSAAHHSAQVAPSAEHLRDRWKD